MGSTERFGYEWGKYSEIDSNYELQFKRWVAPLRESDFQGKKVLDAGCGMGRNSFWVLRWGASHVTAFDYDKRSVDAARKNLEKFANAKVEFKSIYDINAENEFDIVFSIGVIHHLENPKLAIENLIRAAMPGGKILIWVYSREGNEWITRLVNPIRKRFTSKLPVIVVDFLSYFISIPLWALIKIFKGPGAYLKQLSKFSFRHIHSIVFDQLIPEIANYWTRDEAYAILNISQLKDVAIHQPENKQGWTVIGTKI